MDMQQNPFADLIPQQGQQPAPQAQPQSYTIGTPDPARAAQEAREAERLRLAQAADARAAAAAALAASTSPYIPQPDGSVRPRPGGSADPARPQPTTGSARLRQLPNTQQRRLQDGVTNLDNLERALTTFRDDYAGNMLGGVENWMQAHVGGGTPGQNQFWSDVAATDNVARNALFGASLTQGEKDAWERTTISPGMTAQEVRANLTRRVELARAALERLARTNVANGYNREAVEASLGDYSTILRNRDPDMQVQRGTEEGTLAGGARRSQPQWSDPSRPLPNEAEQSLIRSLERLPPGSTERFRVLQRWVDQGGPESSVFIGDDNGPGSGIDAFGVTATQRDQLKEEYERERPLQAARDSREQFARDQPFLAGVDTVVRAGANALTGGIADRAEGVVRGTSPEVQHAITGSDWENRPVLSLAGTLAGGSRLPIGSTLPRQIFAGAGYSGLYGFNARDGDVGDRLLGATGDAFIGGGLTGLIGVGLRSVGRGGGRGPRNPELMQAAERQGVDLMPADVGGPVLGRMTGGTAQTIGGAGPISRAAQQTEQQVGARVADIARREGAPMRQEALGEHLDASLTNFNRNSGIEGRNIYQNARELGDDQLYQGGGAFRNLNSQIREIRETPGTSAPLIGAMERLRSDIASEGGLNNLSIDAARRLRTNVRAEAMSEGLRGTDYQRRATQVLNALSDDIASQLPAEARAEFRRADRLWQDRLDFIDDVETRLLGPQGERSAEQVADRLINMTRSDSARFQRVLETATPEESGIIRGSAIQELGRAREGSPNPGAFSLDTFLTNYEKLPERSRNLLFRGQSRGDAEDLIEIARSRRLANQGRNTSSSGGAINVSNAIRTGSAVTGFGTLGASTLAENLTARMLTSPRLVRILARPPRDPNRAIRALRRVAITDPHLSSDIGRLIQAIQSTGQDLAPAVSSAAADDGQDRR